jgi:lysine-ketoglutarate reductase/saccharopine dehydrogenase-like protein (TIGR00300 family)
MFTETIELRGHILDNQTLPRVLDQIVSLGADYRIDTIEIGHTRKDTSHARVTVTAKDDATLQSVIELIARSGATALNRLDAKFEPAPRDGVLPDDFYATTNLPTEVLIGGYWQRVENAEMDCALIIAEGKTRVRGLRMHRVKKGDLVVVGHAGIRVEAPGRPEGAAKEAFGFMASAVSSEKPKHLVIREIARAIRAAKKRGEKILFVGGPAIVHTGAGPHLEKIIRDGYIDILFAGNALAAHDIESSIFGTSLGVSLQSGNPVEHGHEHHLRTINRIRAAGSIAAAVKKGLVPSGIMRACVEKKIPYVLPGSIRDDGPLPDVIVDMPQAQDAMRALLPGVTIALMVGTTLLSIATGNMLPAATRTICVDINPAVVTKLADRGTFQAIGLVTDAELFLRTLAKELGR